MKQLIVVMMVMTYFPLSMSAQPSKNISYEKVRYAQSMKWICPEIEKYQDLLYSQRNDDFKTYANNIKYRIDLYSNPQQPTDKYLVTQAVFTIENPLFDTENLLKHISSWIKGAKKEWAKNLEMDLKEKAVGSFASIHVASHAAFIETFKVFVTPTLVIQLNNEGNKLLVSFRTNTYENGVYNDKNKRMRTIKDKISEVYPFAEKSSHKITYAKAYVGTYLYFWNFISDLRNELNTNFTKDAKMLNQLSYEYSVDSLRAKYGEPTKVIAEQTTQPNIHKELRFYESAQKFVFMGKTIDFEDIMSCVVVDDPKFIPGRTTTYGLGFSIFGIGIGGADTYTTPNKTIHSYVVNVKIDNMGTPLIYIATGQNKQMANEIAAVFEYILRHQQSNKTAGSQKSKVVTKRTRR